MMVFVSLFYLCFCGSPPVESRSLRYAMLNEHQNVIGTTKAFDGTTLFLPVKITDTVSHWKLLLSGFRGTFTPSVMVRASLQIMLTLGP